MSVSFCLLHPVAVSAFMICRGLCACTEMLWMCVLYVSFGSKVRPRTFGCVAMGSALLFIGRRSSRLMIRLTCSCDNSLQVVELSGHPDLQIVVNTSLQTVSSTVFRIRISLQWLS